MLKVASFDIVFQEIPGEVTLALNLSGCPCHCKGCHSPHLWEDTGEELDEALLDGLVERYGTMITCVAFMGGDQAPGEVAHWAEYVKNCPSSIGHRPSSLKVAWYSGKPLTPETFNTQTSFDFPLSTFDYVKFGPYVEALGGLKSPTTNQRFYKRSGDEWQDMTAAFRHSAFEKN